MSRSPPFSALTPLKVQSESQQLEIEIREAFCEVFQAMLGKAMQSLLHYGSPHLISDPDLMKKFYLADGLSIPRADTDIEYLQYLMKAWRIKNPKRGFHFLETYLQILYPNEWRITPLWQESSQAYPTTLRSEEEALLHRTPHWLTSRIKVEVTEWEETGEKLAAYRPTLQAIIGARFLLELAVLREFGSRTPSEIKLGSAFSTAAYAHFECDCWLPNYAYGFDGEVGFGSSFTNANIAHFDLGEMLTSTSE